MPPVAGLRGVFKEYMLGNVQVAALKGVDLTIEEGEFIALVGPSGSGKTTLLNLIGCIDVPSRGEIKIDGELVSALPEAARAALRLSKLGFVFQNFSLIPVLDVYQNVEVPLLLRGDLSAAERKQRVLAIIERVGLLAHKSKRPSELSGGQQQRVAIARALVGRPRLIIADEPTANLDHTTGRAIVDLMRELNRNEKATVLYSTHDPEMMQLADRCVRMADGQVAPGTAGSAASA